MTFDSACFSYDNWKCDSSYKAAEIPEPNFEIGDYAESTEGVSGRVVDREYNEILDRWSYTVAVPYVEDGEECEENEFFAESELV